MRRRLELRMEPPSVSAPERLFDAYRFPSDSFLLLALLLYAPVGLCLLLLRLFIGIHVFLVSCALPDSLLRRCIVRVMCSVLGLFVRQSDPHLRDASVRVYIANHVTHFDHSVINLLTSCNTPALNGTPGFICWSRGFMELGAVGSRAELVESLKMYSSHRGNPPLLLFPEEAATNGRVGLLHFSSWPFSILDMIQPVALQVQRPLIAVSVADSSWITELLWTFFVPFTVYQVRWMPPVFRQADEPNEEFALRVQELLAMELGVISTRLTAADKAEHMKRLRHTPPHFFAPASSQSLVLSHRASPSLAGIGPLAPVDGRITEMARQVKEVLPHVSLETISRDLAQTNCVDTTIANLLEGRVPLLPEDKESEVGPLAPSTSQTPAASSPQCTLASSSAKPSLKLFAKSPVERHLSLQERKHVLYAYARSWTLTDRGPSHPYLATRMSPQPAGWVGRVFEEFQGHHSAALWAMQGSMECWCRADMEWRLWAWNQVMANFDAITGMCWDVMAQPPMAALISLHSVALLHSVLDPCLLQWAMDMATPPAYPNPAAALPCPYLSAISATAWPQNPWRERILRLMPLGVLSPLRFMGPHVLRPIPSVLILPVPSPAPATVNSCLHCTVL
ncbi:lipid droplet-regulating VLDL assembly factor AUP1 isoform X3 [Carettochelys insculpta]|uniref:lipid droplet-regulating VLDL assembly factor AUP1 isoform X3 n=1 Tax=Carettochelys insculpta TaxID=44489 RepID=UPI003EBBA8C4